VAFGLGGSVSVAIPTGDPIRAKIAAVIPVEAFHEAPLRPLFEPDGSRPRVPMATWIEQAERGLGVPFPEWLRTIYLHCNGFSGPIGSCSLFRLDGDGGVLEFNLFLRQQEWAPSWFQRGILFMNRRVSWTIDTHWGALDDKLIEWHAQENEQYTVLDCDLFALWGREHERGDKMNGE
jgi:hypothetical protein